MKEDLLLHILTNEATDEEKMEFYSELDGDKQEKEYFLELKSLWLRTSVHETTIDADRDFNDLWRKIKQKNNIFSRLNTKQILRYAAIFIFAIGLAGSAGYFIAQQSTRYSGTGIQKYTATRGSTSVIELSDGTKVWLNSESTLTYREDYKTKQRLAELSGEAYFEIAHRDDCPLIVKVGNLQVRDLGTTFNIKAYPEDSYIETSLVEGKAELLNSSGKSIVELKPGESAVYHSKENRIEFRSITENVLSAWRDGKFVIRDQRLDDIFKELSHWYGIEFRFDNEKLKDYRFTGNIKKSTSAVLVLKVLQATTDFNFKIIENVDKPDIVIVY